MTDRQARDQLVLAQQGDHDARKRVALHVYDRYLPRLRGLAKKNDDVAMGLDDMEISFFEGIMRAVPNADGRGDDFFHLGQRGIWAVQTELRSIRRVTRANARVWDGMKTGMAAADPDMDPVARIPDVAAEEAYGRIDDAITARQRIQVLTTAPLKGRLREAVDLIMEGAAGDPREIGFNARLAVRMGVSPQRASQVMGELRKLAA